MLKRRGSSTKPCGTLWVNSSHRENQLHWFFFLRSVGYNIVFSSFLAQELCSKECNKPFTDHLCVHIILSVLLTSIWSISVEVANVNLVADWTHWCKLKRERVDAHAGLDLNISILKSPRGKISNVCLWSWTLCIMVTNSSNQKNWKKGSCRWKIWKQEGTSSFDLKPNAFYMHRFQTREPTSKVPISVMNIRSHSRMHSCICVSSQTRVL